VAELRLMAAAVSHRSALMLVSEHAAPAAVHYLPGGKPEPGEAPLDCLRREVGEEVGCEVIEPQLLAEVRAPAALKGVDST
jgi:8-oxo-dGTP diphosphatase